MAKEQPKIDPARQHFDKSNYENLIRKGNTPGADAYVSNRKKFFLWVMIGIVCIGTIVGCIISYNKYKKQEEALALGNGYYDINGDWRSFDKPNGISAPDINVKAPSLEKPEEVVIPKIEPSDEIINADILSGSFQLGPYMYTLPMKMSDFLDTGVRICRVNTTETDGEGVVMGANIRERVVLCYDDYTYFDVVTYDTESVGIMDSTIICVEQSLGDDTWNNNSQYIYLPGGLHVELDGSSAAAIYDVGDGLLVATDIPSISSDAGTRYNYNGKYEFPWNPMNFIQYLISQDQVYSIQLYKNR